MSRATGSAAYEQGYSDGYFDEPMQDYTSDSYYNGYEDGALAAHEDESWNDDDGLSDAEADAMTLASAGYGMDEDYLPGGPDFDYGWDF